MQSTCPRCAKGIDCEASDVQLHPQTLAFLEKTDYGCLCNACLEEVQRLLRKAQALSFPTTAQGLKENLHYYIDEQGRWVFTEFYLLQRGFCCGNGCKHCAYGNKKSTNRFYFND